MTLLETSQNWRRRRVEGSSKLPICIPPRFPLFGEIGELWRDLSKCPARLANSGTSSTILGLIWSILARCRPFGRDWPILAKKWAMLAYICQSRRDFDRRAGVNSLGPNQCSRVPAQILTPETWKLVWDPHCPRVPMVAQDLPLHAAARWRRYPQIRILYLILCGAHSTLASGWAMLVALRTE